MTQRRELALFAAALAALVAGFFAETLFGGKILGSADVLLASASFRAVAPANYEPANRLLMDPTLQFEPWIEFNCAMIRAGRLPLWNSAVGCGAPHLANGQAAVFDPFQVIAYLGTVPGSLGPMAAARLWFAGMGAFLLARTWGLEGWGRWFAGLTFPGCGFLVAWLLYPVTNAAIWLPWIFLATDAVWARPTWRRAACLAFAVAGTLLGGHVQTAAHVLLAAGTYAAWLTFRDGRIRRPVLLWAAGIVLGIGLAAVEVVPLAAYLARSPVWGDRDQERVEPWRVVRPRLLEAACTALPSLYGSQRRGEPNLARAVGVENQNESAGGYAGLATLIWLAPLAWGSRRANPRVGFLVGLTLFGCAAAFRLPPVDNLLRVVPVLKVTDNRRLTLWIAFGLTMLGGVGLDRVGAARGGRGWAAWGWAWVGSGVLFVVAALAVGHFGPAIRSRAIAHYERAARATPGADLAEYRDRAGRQAAATVAFVPHYLLGSAAEVLALAGLLAASRRGRVGPNATRAALLGLTLAGLARFGVGLNPALDPALDRPMTPLIADLQRRVGSVGRVIGLGAEFPPNALMRYGLRDARNYDSVELARNLDWLRPLYDPSVAAQTSRREITWDRVDAARDRLRAAGVRAVVAATPPPPGFACLGVDRYPAAWVAWLDADPLVALDGPGTCRDRGRGDGEFLVEIEATGAARLQVRETYDPGWVAEVDGRPVPVEADRGTFLHILVPPGRHRVALRYDPAEVRIALIAAGFAALGIVFALTGILDLRSTRSVVPRLGWTQALGLESDSRLPPGRPTRCNTEGTDADGPLHV